MGPSPNAGRAALIVATDSESARAPRSARAATSYWRRALACIQSSSRTNREFAVSGAVATHVGAGRQCGSALVRPRGRTASRRASVSGGPGRRARWAGSPYGLRRGRYRQHYPFNSFFNSLRKRQSVPCAMISCGVFLRYPVSRRRRAWKRRAASGL